jgi:membrane protease YdiL (CAAX protease family)
MIVVEAIWAGIIVLLAGTIPRNLLFSANLKYFTGVPWAVPLMAAYLWLFWRYLNLGWSAPAAARRADLRANRLSAREWLWALVAGGLGLVTLVVALGILNRLVVLPRQEVPDLTDVSRFTMFALLAMSAPLAGVVEEAAFRGYMQRPIERRHGLFVAILITGTMFAIAHLDFTPVLWPYYVAVAAIYGSVASLTDSILPAVVLHTAGNLYSNFDLWLQGQAEWQASATPDRLIWVVGIDRPLLMSVGTLLVVGGATIAGYVILGRVARRSRPVDVSSRPAAALGT